MNWLHRLVAPRLANEKLRRQGFVVVIVSLAMIGLTTTLSLYSMMFDRFRLIGMIVSLAIPLYIVAIFLVHRSAILPAAYIVTWTPIFIIGFLLLSNYDIIASLFLVLPILLSTLVLSNRHMLLVIFFCVILALTSAIMDQKVYFGDYFSAVVLLVTVSGLAYLGAWSVDRAMQEARNARKDLEVSNTALHSLNDELETRVTLRTADLQTALSTVQQQEQNLQQTLAELRSSQQTIQELSAPVLPVAAGVLVAPLIGVINSQRASVLTQAILYKVEHYRAHYLIIDVTGVDMIDTQVAQVLLQTTHALRLIGAQVIITGIRPEVAQTLVSLGVNMSGIMACSTLELGISEALNHHSLGQHAAVI